MAKLVRVVQIIGPVVDCEFEENKLPAIYNCVIIEGRRAGRPQRQRRTSSIWGKTACAASACSLPTDGARHEGHGHR
jgi:F0F1-type ATP synthase beta subunit